jgi:hypothetical protein
MHLYIGIATPVRSADLVSNGRLAVLGFFTNELNSSLRNCFVQQFAELVLLTLLADRVRQ